MVKRTLALAALASLWGTIAAAQTTPEDMAAMRAAQEEYERKPDTFGSGPYPAIREMDAGLPRHVVYRPRDLAGAGKLGILLWGNGGCMADGASARFHLTEIASHGYVAIAPGTIRSGPGAPPRDPTPPRAVDPTTGSFPPVETTAADVLAGLDWILAENERPDSPYYQRIDSAKVAVSGHSCGGLQAILVAADPRIHAVVIHNSGVFDGPNPITGMTVTKEALKAFHTPILYILGGPTDIAYPNGMDDFAKIDAVPVFVANLPVGHLGTFFDANGGRAAQIALAWLNWQLDRDASAKVMFAGPDCGLCKSGEWKVDRKGLH